MITINPQSADVVTINISDADQIQLNTTAIVLAGSGTGGGNADTLNNQSGAFYLSRDNHTGSDQISDVQGLQSTLDEMADTDADLQAQVDLKLNSADYNDRFLGLFSSFSELVAAHATASAGDYAQVDFGAGADVIIYAYDVSDANWTAVGSSAIANTDVLPEGSVNLYYTGQRVRETPLTGFSTATATEVTAADSVLSAAGKLQAQITAVAVNQSVFYRSGEEYTQDFFCSAVSSISVVGGNLSLSPFRVLETVTISKIAMQTSAQVIGAFAKAAIYRAELVGAHYALTRVTDQCLIDVQSAGITDRADVSATLYPNNLYFYALKNSVTRNYQSIPASAALGLGFQSNTKITSFVFSEDFSIDLPLQLSTAGAVAGLLPPPLFRFRKA